MTKKLRVKISQRLLKKRSKRLSGQKRKHGRLDDTTFIDYKDVDLLRGFLTERGKILPARVSGNKACRQRELAIAIKRARIMALIPYTAPFS